METSQTKLKLRVIIKLKSGNSLSKGFWSSFYQFIKSAEENNLTQDIVENLRKFAIILISTSQQRIGKNNICDVDDEYDFPFTLNTFKRYDKNLYNLCYSIIYHKSENHDDLEIDKDVTEIIPFFLLDKYYSGRLTLGIKPSRNPKNQGFYFKCSVFFDLIYSEPAELICGKNYFYFIDEFIDEEQKVKLKAKALARKRDNSDIGKKRATESRWYFPMFEINKHTYDEIFINNIPENTNEQSPITRYIIKSLSKIQQKNDQTVSNSHDTEKSSLFEKWFEAAYRYSSDANKDDLPEEYKRTLAIYRRSIFELVQNIKFHAIAPDNEEGWGYIYCIFDKTNNLSQEHKDNLPKFEENKNIYEKDDFRFLKVGICDWGKLGIVEKFKKDNPQYANRNFTLKDFFSKIPLDLRELSLLEVRASAKLGIKTFVSTLNRYNGYFRVETNNNGVKIEISTKKEGSKDELLEQRSLNNINGTHYEIILPVGKTEEVKEFAPTPPLCKIVSSLKLSDFIAPPPIITINFADIKSDFSKISNVATKEEQINAIESTTKLIQKKLGDNKPDSFAIDCCTIESEKGNFTTTIFKIIANLQQTCYSIGYKRIILFNLSKNEVDDIFKEVEGLLNLSSTKWSDENAVILMSSNLYCKIICGKDEQTMEYLNHELAKLYPYTNYIDDNKSVPNDTKQQIAQEFIFLYDLSINDANGKPYFIAPFKQHLYRDIISNDNKIGFRVNHKYTDILNQVIVEDYYETDLMFKNSFYVERFAISIASSLYNRYNRYKIEDSKLILIGYKNYSEFLLNRIKNYLLEYIEKDIKIEIVLANNNTIRDKDKDKDKDKRDRINFIAQDEDFHELLQITNTELEKYNSSNEVEKTYEHQKFIERKEKYLKKHWCAIIVPIGTTLRTNDKIASFWKQEITRLQAIGELIDIYNHCVIVVRDKIDSTPTNLEKQFKWSNVEDKEQLITTNFENAKEIYYTIQIAKVEDDKNNGEGNWLHKLNAKVSFKEEYWDEEYVNPTKDSINSSYIMDFPNNIIDIDEKQHNIEIDRLLALKEFCHSGHIEAFDSHHRHYIDTEAFVRDGDKKAEYTIWLKTIKKETIFNSPKIHILITPEAKIESKFVNDINNSVFNGQALIINLDLKDRIENTITKLSYLKGLQNKETLYHFVDHVLHTGDTYWRVRSFLNSFVNSKIHSIISLINRTPNSKTNEIKQSVNHNLFTFLTLNYPAIKQKGRMCYLCDLKRHYENMRDNSVSIACRQVIKENIEKNEVKYFRSKGENKENEEKRKYRFYRLVLTHEILYLIREIPKESLNYEKKNTKISEVLDNTYDKLIRVSCDKKTSDLFSDSLEKLVKGLNMNDYDAKISFIKVLSSPPLSSYVVIRKYVHNKLLTIVKETLKTTNPSGNDLKLLKASLKCLSYLKSNALIRKEVILGAWDFISKIKSLPEIDLTKFREDFLFYIKYSIFSDETKAYFLGELLRTGNEPNIDDACGMEISRTKPEGENGLLKHFTNSDVTKKIADEYSSFLENLFYDNTTIFRKTLNNFVFELDKEKGGRELREYFYDDNSGELKKFNDIQNSIDDIKKKFEKIIKEEYYYDSFKKYLNNGDEIKYLEKLIYTAYAKLKLNELINHKQGAEQDTKDLIEIFTKIMGADSAFLAMNLEKQPHVISTCKLNDREEWDYNNWFLQNNYSTRNALTGKNIKAPIVQNFNIDSSWGEKRDLRAHSLALYLIGEANKNYGTITFLYYDQNSIITSGEKVFKVQVQESGRLLLLLKQEIDKYFIDFLLNEKVLDLWLEKQKHELNYSKVYTNNAHINNFPFSAMQQFETLEDATLRQFSLSWYQISNQLINYLYSTIISNPEHKLNFTNHPTLFPQDTELGDIFTNEFKNIINGLLENKWNKDRDEETHHKIYFDIKDEKTCVCGINIHIIRTFIAQHIDNCLNKHCDYSEQKTITIKVTQKELSITETAIKCDYEKRTEAKKAQKDLLAFKKKLITEGTCDIYSSTTFTSLQGYINYLSIQQNELSYSFDFGFNEEHHFYLTIKYERK